MRKYKLLTMGLALTMVLSSFCACSSDTSDETSESDDLIEVEGVEETEEKTEQKVELTTDSLGDFCQIEDVWDFNNSKYQIFSNDSSGLAVPCCFDDYYIYVASLEELDADFNGNYVMKVIDRYTFQTISTVEIGDFSTIEGVFSLFMFNGYPYLYAIDYMTSSPILYKITDPYTLEEDVELLDSIRGPYREFDDSTVEFEARKILRKVFDYQDGVVLLFTDTTYENLDEDYSLVFLSNDGKVNRIDLEDTEAVEPDYIEQRDYYISAFTYGEKYLVVKAGYKYKVFDVTTFEEVEVSIPYEVLMSYNISSGKGGNYYVNTLEGFFETNPDTGIMDQLIDYNLVVGDTSILNDSRFLYEDSSGYYFLCTTREAQVQSQIVTTRLFRISPCVNPYGGKVVLDLASAESDADLVRAVKSYNDHSDKYFIRYHICDGSVPTTSKQLHFDGGDYYTLENGNAGYEKYTYSKAKSEQQKMKYINSLDDIDILYGFGCNEAFDSENYCLDLSSIVPDDDSKYYMNIINANKKSDGSLYSVPLVFDFSSLTYFSYEGNYEVDDLFNADGGITFESYEEMIDKYAGNYDPIGSVALPYELFRVLFENEADRFVNLESSEQNFDADAFKKLVSFTKDHADSNRYAMYDAMPFGDLIIDYVHNCSIEDEYIYTSYDDDETIVALMIKHKAIPSIDGRGYAADIRKCVSVSSKTDDFDGASEFVLYLLDSYQQSGYTFTGYSVSRERNDELQKHIISIEQSGDCFDGDDFKVNVEEALASMDSVIGKIDRITFKDDIVTYSYMSQLLKYYEGNINEDTLVSNVEQALETTVADLDK